MRRLFALLVLVGLGFSVGCGDGNKVIEPKDKIPDRPKGRPTAGTPDGKGEDAKGNTAPEISP
jgi:hypothetical protein